MASAKQYRDRTLDVETQVQFRCPQELRTRLADEARRRTVSMNYLIQRALEESLTKWERQRL
jgi:predicted HicB family RNase H-like nuclease